MNKESLFPCCRPFLISILYASVMSAANSIFLLFLFFILSDTDFSLFQVTPKIKYYGLQSSSFKIGKRKQYTYSNFVLDINFFSDS